MNLDTVRTLHEQGSSDSEIGAMVGASKDAVYRFRRKYGIGYPNITPPVSSGKTERGPSSETWRDPERLKGRRVDDVGEFLEGLTPISLPAPPKPKSLVSPNDLEIVASDFHFPEHSEEAMAVFFRTVEELRPRRVTLNGDTTDMLACSVYPKDQRDIWSLRSETEAFHKFLHTLHSIGDAWGMQVVETDANHSGNSVSGRWHRYLSSRVPELYKHPLSSTLLDYRTWFYPDWSNITLEDHIIIQDDLLVIHGDVVRGGGGNSARGMGEKWQSSVMHGHTHRIGSSTRRIPAIGSRPEGLRRMYETGCMCDLKPSYVSAPDWANGFAIISTGNERYGVELVHIINGSASVCALGKTVKAA